MMGEMNRLLSLRKASLAGQTGCFVSGWLLAAAAVTAQSLPVVTHGDAQVVRQGGETVVRLSKSSRLEWRDFLVPEKGRLRFLSEGREPRASLNIVRGNVPARIFGEITADGPFYLISPAGINVGSQGRITAPRVLLSALPAQDDLALLEGRPTTFQNRPGGNSSVSVAGQVVATNGSLTVLAPSVQVSGVLEARQGAVRVIGADQQPVQGPDAQGEFQMTPDGAFKTVSNNGRITGARVEILSDGFIQNGGRLESVGTPASASVVRLASRGTRHELKTGSAIVTRRLQVEGSFEQQGPVIFPQDGANPSALGGIRQTPRLSRPGFFTNAEAGMTQLSHSPLQNSTASTSPLPRPRGTSTVASRSGGTGETVTSRKEKRQPTTTDSLRKASFFGQTVRK